MSKRLFYAFRISTPCYDRTSNTYTSHATMATSFGHAATPPRVTATTHPTPNSPAQAHTSTSAPEVRIRAGMRRPKPNTHTPNVPAKAAKTAKTAKTAKNALRAFPHHKRTKLNHSAAIGWAGVAGCQPAIPRLVPTAPIENMYARRTRTSPLRPVPTAAACMRIIIASVVPPVSQTCVGKQSRLAWRR